MGGWSGGWDFGEKISLGALPGARMFSATLRTLYSFCRFPLFLSSKSVCMETGNRDQGLMDGANLLGILSAWAVGSSRGDALDWI